MPILIMSGTDLADRGDKSSQMNVFLSVFGLALIAVGLVGSAVTMGRDSSR